MIGSRTGLGSESSPFNVDADGNVTLNITTASFVLPENDDAATPTLAFGGGTHGFYLVSDQIKVAISGVHKWTIDEEYFLGSNGGGTLRNRTATATAVTVSPTFTDSDTGLGSAAADQLSLIAGQVEGIRITEDTTITITNNGWMDRHTVAGITASTTQSQGQQPLTGDINQISVCANANDTVTLPTAVPGRACVIINSGAQTARVYPASNDNLGAGVDTPGTLAAAKIKRYIAYDATNWVGIAEN